MFVGELRRGGMDVCVVDSRMPAEPGVRFLRGDVTKVDRQLAGELCKADLVLLAVPEPVAVDALPEVTSAMKRGALLMDTVSVKDRVVAAGRAMTGHVEMLSVNPMFAPSLGIAGRPVAAVVVHDGPRCAYLLRLLANWGARIVVLTSEQHDRLAGASQALTHAAVLAFGLALCELDVAVGELTAIAPPPHATMLAMLARITAGNPDVYWDVQAGNPQAPAARKALATAMHRFAHTIDHGDETEFAGLLNRLRNLLGPELPRHQDACARAFQVV